MKTKTATTTILVPVPDTGELGDIHTMSPGLIDWVLTHLEGDERQMALGVGPGHYRDADVANAWYVAAADKLLSSNALMELNEMYAEMAPRRDRRNIWRDLPAQKPRPYGLDRLTTEQAVWVMTHVEGKLRQQLLGVTPSHYRSRMVAERWRNQALQRVGHHPESCAEVAAMHAEMLAA